MTLANTCRLDFVPSEQVALARDLEPLERKAAKARHAAAGPGAGKGKKQSAPGKFPEAVPARARDKIAAAVGVDRKTLAKAEAVVVAGIDGLRRRNLTPDQARLLRGRRYNRLKKPQGFQDAGPGRGKTLDQNDPVFSTAEKLATQHGVSAPTIKRDGQFASAVETLKPHVPDIEEPFQRGELALALKPLIAAQGKARLITSTGGATPRPLEKSPKAEPINTRVAIARAAGLSDNTIAKVEVIAAKAPEPVKEQLRRGEISIDHAYQGRTRTQVHTSMNLTNRVTGADAKEARDRRIFDLWLACWTDKTTADDVGLTEEAVRLITQKSADLPQLGKPQQAAAEHAADFEPPLYNIWKQQEKSAGSGHFGNSEARLAQIRQGEADIKTAANEAEAEFRSIPERNSKRGRANEGRPRRAEPAGKSHEISPAATARDDFPHGKSSERSRLRENLNTAGTRWNAGFCS